MKRFLALALSGLVLLGAAPASADAPVGDAVSTWEAAVAKKIGLDASQTSALHTYDVQLASGAGADTALDEDHLRAMSLPQRLDWVAQHAATDAELLKDRAAAARRFYATLSVDQQRQFDELTLPKPQEVTAPTSVENDLPPPLPNYRLPSYTDATGLVVSVEALSRLYPSAAVPKHILGKTMLHCTVDVDGYLSDCSVQSETPPDEGFGNAALEATGFMRMRPATNYGVPVRSPINVPLTFAPN